MKKLGIAAAAVIILLLVFRHCREDEAATPKPAAKPVATSKTKSATQSQERPDIAKLQRASIEGVVTDEKSAPLAKAKVCAAGESHELEPDAFRDVPCATTDDAGHYKLELLPAKYIVTGSAKPFRPEIYHPAGDRKEMYLRLAAGQHATGVDIQLRAGGVEITGTVFDLTGGPIDKARVMTHATRWDGGRGTVMTETAADGTFSLWVAPGSVSLVATAEGYADDWDWTKAPGKVEFLLTPDSSLDGIVIDAASGAPIAGARVGVGGSEWTDDGTFSDAAGKFHVARLTPGRYVATAHTDHGYGRTDGSTLVGLGQHVDGVVVKLHPAVRIEGKIVIAATKQPCTHPEIGLADGPKGRWVDMNTEPDGRVWAEGVLPGKYIVDVGCAGYQSREKYDPVEVADKDVTGLVWEVDAGAKITGRVLAKGGAPLEDANVSARTVGDKRNKGGWADDRSAHDGTFTLDGLKPGTYKIEVGSDKAVAPKEGWKVEVAAGATVQKDLVLEETGSIRGMVVDETGKPVSNIHANAIALSGSMYWRGDNEGKTDDGGSFTIDSLRPGDYRVSANRTWNSGLRKPGTTDDAEQGERVTVRANQTASVKIVVEAQAGVIKGVVVDAANAPVPDAFISAARESDAAGAQKTSVQQTRWSWDEKPVLTNVDGSFTLTKLSPGSYTVRAYRKGGGEAVSEHVAIGGNARLQIKPTGSITGVVKAGAKIEEFAITLRDLQTGFSRRESFFRTDGKFSVPDLPKGKFQLSATAEAGQTQIDVELAEGEKKDISVELAGLLNLTGRVVEHGTQKPVAGIRMTARPAMGGGGFGWTSAGDERKFITDDAGKFTLENAPSGKLIIRGFPRDWNDSDYAGLSIVRSVDASGDLGDIEIFRNRIKQNDPAGKLGINFVQSPPDTPPDKKKLEVSWIDPAGPAAKTDIKVGDVITTIDGVDVTGANNSTAQVLLRAAPGTKLSLGLARNTTITVVLAPP